MSDEQRKRAWWPGAVLLLLILYPLSAGPVIRLWARLHDDPAKMPLAIVLFYTPLFVVVDAIGASEIMIDYLNWFGSL